MADVRLDGADQDTAIRRPALAQDSRQGLSLDRIAEGRAGAVGLDISDLGRAHAAVGQGVPNDSFLRGSIGRREPTAPAVLVDSRSADHRQDPIPIGKGVGQALEHDKAAALAPHEPVRPVVEGLAAPVRGHHPGLGERNRVFGPQDHVHASRQGEGALAQAQALAGEVDRDQRRRAGRIH